MRRPTILITILAALTALGGASRAAAHGPMPGERVNDLTRLADAANLVVVGEVTAVAYRLARIEGGEGELPFTIVTYTIRKALRGKAPGSTFTMRFPGGSDGRGHFTEVSGVPVFQPGEQDVLFIAGNGENGCPLVECEWGRFRISRDAVYNTHGSPVRGLLQLHAVSRGLPAEEFRRFSFPAPSFDELIKSPEVQKLLQAQNLGIEEARKRYEAEAPKQIEVRAFFPEAAKEPLDAVGAEQATTAQPRPRATPPTPEVKLAAGPVALPQFLSAVGQAVSRARRQPVELKSASRDAEIVVRVNPRLPPTLTPPKAGAAPKTPQEEAELKALLAQDFNPVVKR